MILEQSISPQFAAKIKEVAGRLNINPDWLIAVMFKESNLNPAAVNKFSGATGLIQFMPATAAAMGTSTAAIKNMDAIQQMELVYQYLRPYKSRINSFVDTYLAVFFPAAIGKTKDTILQTSNLSAMLIASQNPAMDANKDQKITIQEVENWLFKGFSQSEILQLQKKKI